MLCRSLCSTGCVGSCEPGDRRCGPGGTSSVAGREADGGSSDCPTAARQGRHRDRRVQQLLRQVGLLPIYPLVGRVDNVNFRAETVWEGSIREGLTLPVRRQSPPGYQYITEAAYLGRVPSATYDFLLSSHTIEHMANPLRALEEWQRVLKPGGILVVVIPHKDGTFDHRLPVTPLTHLVQDYLNQVGEDDLSHLEEILMYHDLSKDVPRGRSGELPGPLGRQTSRNRCLHQHVFDTYATIAMLDQAGVQLQQVEAIRPYHIVAVGRTPSTGKAPEQRTHFFPPRRAPWRHRSPFPSDQDRDTNSAALRGVAACRKGIRNSCR